MLPSNTTSVRAYHHQSLSLDNGSRQQIALATQDDTELSSDAYRLADSERVFLKAVWKNGLSESTPLPESVETVRQKYDMAGREYDHYWRLAAGSLTPILHIDHKARSKLRTIESQKEKFGEYSIVPKNKGGKSSSHGILMREAILLSKTMRGIPVSEMESSQVESRASGPQHAIDREKSPKQVAALRNLAYQKLQARKKAQAGDDYSTVLRDPKQGQRTASSSSTKNTDQDVEPTQRHEDKQETRNDGSSRRLEAMEEDEDSGTKEVRQQVEGLLDDMEKYLPVIWSPETLEAQHNTASFSRLSRNENSEQKRPGVKRVQKPRTRDEQLTVDEVQKAQRRKKLRELSEQRIELQKKRDELKEKLRAEEEKQFLAKKAADEAPLRARQARIDKEASSDLSDVLDIAMENELEKNRPMENRTLPIRRIVIDGLPSFGSRSIKLDSANFDTTMEAHEQCLDTLSKSAPEEPTRPSNDLYLSVPTSGKIPIDSDLTLTLNSDKPTLQSQVRAMQSRLSASYPRIDALPYNIAESENKQTLQTWLKVLAGRWQSRLNEGQGTAHFDPQLKAVLDQLVRDHDLSNDAAIRMAEKWINIFERRNAKAGGIKEELDEEEVEAGGMSFLRVGKEETEAVMDSGENEGHEGVLQVGETTTEIPADECEVALEASFETKLSKKRPTKDQETIVEKSDELVNQDETNDSVAKDPSTPKTIPIMSPSKPPSSKLTSLRRRLYSTSSRPPPDSPQPPSKPPSLPHLTPTGSAHMVSVSAKAHTTRTAIAIGTVHFSNPTPLSLIKTNSLKKGDVLSVSRIAGIMAAKKCPDLIPLCHPIALTHVGVELQVFSPTPDSDGKGFGGVNIEAKVECTGQTGVEMEALTSVMGTALSVVDMCKAVDKGMWITDVRVVLKEGGRSGVWREEGWRSWQE
jgi:molybdenum cofactor biosynthesis protein MoaC